MFKSFFGGKQQQDEIVEASNFISDTQPETISSLLPSHSPAYPHQQLAKPDDDIEYLFIEENPFGLKTERPTGSFGPLPMRNNSDKLLYGTGAMYLAGLSSGGLYGFFRGLSLSKGHTLKLKTNSILNMVTRYGPFAANSLGVLATTWALLDISISELRGGVSDYYNHTGAAALSGLLFKSTAGVRPAILTGGIMAGVVGLWGLVVDKEEISVKFPKFGTGKAKMNA